MTRRRPRTYNLPDEQLRHLAGVRVTQSGSTCSRCGEPLLIDERAVRHRGGWMHTHCSSGADDE